MRLGKFLFKEEASSGEVNITSGWEIMSPGEFVEKYGKEDSSEEEVLAEGLRGLYNLLFEAEYEKRIARPPQSVLTPGGDIKGAEVKPERFSDILATRAERDKQNRAGRLPADIPYIHPGTAKATVTGAKPRNFVPAGGLVKSKRPEEIAVVDENEKPIDLKVLVKTLTSYDRKNFKILKQNQKMVKSTTGEYEAFYNIGIPAIMGLVFDQRENKFKVINTCPSAGICLKGCYAIKGGYVQYQGSSETQSILLNLLYNHPEEYVKRAVKEIVDVVVKNAKYRGERKSMKTVIRWHDAGDFFSADYLRLALHIIEKVKEELPFFLRDHVEFYAYTKRVKLTKELGDLTKDLLLRKSLGARAEEEAEIDPETDMFSQIVPKEVKDELIEKGVIEKVGGKPESDSEEEEKEGEEGS